MANFLNDGSLIGFWPLNEPSGSPVFKNYSPSRSRRPSGISFDFHVALSDAQDNLHVKSVWPGTSQVYNPGSGTTLRGYMPQGVWKIGADSSPYAHYLVLGGGTKVANEQVLTPNVAQSGFTVGFWVYPNSDGYATATAAGDINTSTSTWETEMARCHGLISDYSFNGVAGWHFGISGQLDRAAQNNFAYLASRQLCAFVTGERNGTTVPTTIRIPIESGVYTHLTFTNRIVNGTTTDEWVLYKNGRVAASGNPNTAANANLSLANATLVGRSLAIGASDQGSAVVANIYEGTSGWNHLMSGVYFFRRPLNEGEILDLHNGQTLQPLDGNIKTPARIELTDPQLLAHYPLRSIGLQDVSKNHRPLMSTRDEGLASALTTGSGPFGGGAPCQIGTTPAYQVAAASGLIYDMINGRSWTIAMHAAPTLAQANGTRTANMLFSMGSISTASNGAATGGTVTAATFGMALTDFNTTTERMRLEVYPLGDISASAFFLDVPMSGFQAHCHRHFAVAYDDSTKGIAIYLDGHLSGSGTLNHSLSDQLLRLAGSGYPLLFTNGVTDTIADTTARGMVAAGGAKLSFGPITIMGRALVGPELLYIAQSGIDTTSTWRTPYDSRLMGYWPCSDYKMDDVVVEDRARVWNLFPANLVRGETNAKWSAFYSTTRTNQFATRTTPPELASYGVLGITSGCFSVHGLSQGNASLLDALGCRTSLGNLTARFRAVGESNDLVPQNVLGEFVLAYDVTPSGNIPLTALGLSADNTKFEFNSTLCVLGSMGASTGDGELRSFLTTVDAAQGSGVTLVFASRIGAFATPSNYKPLISGVLPYGVPSKVLLHSKFDSPYSPDAVGTTQMLLTLWINGSIAAQTRRSSINARLWSGNAPDGVSDTSVLQFGGEAGTQTFGTQITRDGGLGDIYLREIYLMRGAFDPGEIAALAASGIQNPTITGFTPTQAKTAVNIADSALQGYWRFSGTGSGIAGGGGSGTKDLSLKFHHLTPLCEERNRFGAPNISSRSLKFIPGPFAHSDLGVQCSGITFEGSANGSTSLTPAFAVSGIAFDSPQNGFSVGFYRVGRTATQAVLAYGLTALTVSTTTSDLDRGWIICGDATSNFLMTLSLGGNQYLAQLGGAHQSGQLVCGVNTGDQVFEDLTRFEQYQYGNQRPPVADYYSHYCWVWDPTAKDLICYVNGNEVDRKHTHIGFDPYNGGPASGLNPAVPARSAARMITFMQHQQANPWDFTQSIVNDEDSILTDVFYFSRALTVGEVRYISQNGIDNTMITTTSGQIGGYIRGQDTGSGLIGGYQRGQGTGSGLFGGFDFGATQGSGLIGGYVSGIMFATPTSGILGGYIFAANLGSGMIGGYLLGANLGSGLIGGFMYGTTIKGLMQFDGGFTLQAFSAKDFDAQVVLRKSTTADFDAKLVIFQAETGPLVDIIVPDHTVSGVTAPFNQYFVGAASGTQGKSIVQTRWTFGDLTPAISVAESGAGFFPTQHHYAASGFYIAKFEAIDSDGIHSSAIRIINAASGIDPVIASLSGVPRTGNAALTVDFTNTVDILPPGVAITASLLNFDDGQSTITFNPTHVYTEPGDYKPIWVVRDSRGVFWCDSLEAGNDYLKEQQ